MAKSRPEMDESPKPPAIPSASERSENSGLDGWKNSNDPYEGRFVDHDDKCPCQACSLM